MILFLLFGVEAVGQPDRRPLVRHGFWPEDYHPLRKGALLPADFTDDARFPFGRRRPLRC